MKKKLCTSIDIHILKKAKKIALERDMRLNYIIEQAIIEYIDFIENHKELNEADI